MANTPKRTRSHRAAERIDAFIQAWRRLTDDEREQAMKLVRWWSYRSQEPRTDKLGRRRVTQRVAVS